MKKRDLLLAGLLLMGVSAFAQPTLNPDKDAKVIFTQTFEDDWDHWQSTPVDTIKIIEYYDHEYEGNKAFSEPWNNRSQWQKGIFRTDSVTPGHEGGIMMFNGVKVADNMDESGRFWKKDDYKILKDDGDDRAKAFALYGEDGGDNVFYYKSDSCGESNAYSPEYRRNLFVRGLDIQDNTSYRLTFFVKVKTAAGKTTTPRLRAGVLRGFFRSEKPFSMGLENDNDHYKYNVPLQYEKTDFEQDTWTKVTYMTYYLNDSIANDYCLIRGYWWAEDSSWYWKKDAPGNTSGKDLFYVVQPDKSWVRLSFSSDYTEFWLDNLSLTRSWIGGAEYYNDKMRVDFGYRTNMDTLVMNNKKITGIDQLEIPNTGENQDKYVVVWCQKQDDSWQKMPIRSAEYHSDGYMYIFTDYYNVGGQDVAFKFGDYKKVLVSFNNPSDPKLQLKYRGTGKTPSSGDIATPEVVFPNALDTVWIKNDRVVFDFSNELATPNPSTKAWEGVHSLADLPPVMVKAPFEDGSFGITPTNEIKFKFSREVQFDNSNTTTKAIAYVGSERWLLEWSKTDSMLVLKRDVNKTLAENASANVTAPLAGDYTITISNIAAKGTEKGANVVYTYHFGSFDRDASAAKLIASDWRSEIVETGAWDRPVPASLWCYNVTDGFYTGEGKNYSPYKKCGLYKMKDDGVHGNAFFYLSARENGKNANLYTVENLKKGKYTLGFGCFGWARNNINLTVYAYAKPATMTYEALQAVADKVQIGKKTPSVNDSWSGNDDERSWKSDAYYYTFDLNIEADGDYVIEWVVDKNGSQDYYGVAIGNYTITPEGASSLYASALSLNNAVKSAQARARLANANTTLYSGTALTKLEAKINEYKTSGSFDAAHAANQEPTTWKNAVKDLNSYTNWVAARMDTIDAEQTKIADAQKELDGLSDDYKKFDVTATLVALVDSATKKFDVTKESGKTIADMTSAIDKAITAVKDRATKNDNLAKLIEDAQKEVKAKEREDYPEYGALVDTLAKAVKFDAITAKDADVDAMSSTLSLATLLYTAKVSGWKGQTARLKAYRELAYDLDIKEMIGNWAVSNFVDTTQVDNDEIAEIYKAAIKYQIYKTIDEIEDEIDVTPFIKNFNLYVTPKIVERTDIKANSSKAQALDTLGCQIQHVQHQWNGGNLNGQQPIWVMIQTHWYDDLYPGWSVWAGTDGNAMVTPDNSSYSRLSNGLECFDAQLAMDWNGKAEIKEVLTGLPAGYYQLGVGFLSMTGSNTQLKAQTWKTLEGGKDTLITLESKKPSSGAKSVALDSILYHTGKDSLTIDLVLTSGNGWSEADNFTLIYLGKDPKFNYASAVAAAKADFENKLNNRVTLVNTPKAQAGRVEFYNAGGQKVNAPKSGLYIKVENGVATKVYVK